MDNLPAIALVLICLGACSLIMALVWVWANKIKNAGVVDIFWSYSFPVIAVILFFWADGFWMRKLLICAMIGIAGLRLGTHLLNRVVRHLHKEEGRYQHLRNEWAPVADRKFFWFFQMQAFSNVLLAIPFFLATINKTPVLHWCEYFAAGLWTIAFLGETLADRQLHQFKNNPANQNKVCNTGLWNYSRHPNYFFEWLMWVAYFVFALASPYGWLAIVSPAIMLYLLLKVTGIPATEEQSLRSKGDLFRAYQKTTSVFIPWFKKHGN